MKQNILVIGGTGKTGRRVAENLTQSGHNVRVVGRITNPAFDWEDPETYAQETAATGIWNPVSIK